MHIGIIMCSDIMSSSRSMFVCAISKNFQSVPEKKYSEESRS